jgi:hypothetical protein
MTFSEIVWFLALTRDKSFVSQLSLMIDLITPNWSHQLHLTSRLFSYDVMTTLYWPFVSSALEAMMPGEAEHISSPLHRLPLLAPTKVSTTVPNTAGGWYWINPTSPGGIVRPRLWPWVVETENEAPNPKLTVDPVRISPVPARLPVTPKARSILLVTVILSEIVTEHAEDDALQSIEEDTEAPLPSPLTQSTQ